MRMVGLSIALGDEKFVGSSSPTVSLTADKRWCGGLRSLGSDSYFVPNIKESRFRSFWNVFEDNFGYSELNLPLPPCLYGHFDIIALDQRSQDSDVFQNFGFTFDNTKNGNRLYSIAHVYSHQMKKTIIEGYAVPPGKVETLVRHQDEDRSFCLSKHTDATDLLRENKALSDIFFTLYSEKKDVCLFTIMVMRGKERAPHREAHVQVNRIGHEVDEVDGSCHKVRPDLSHAKFVRGGSTGVNYKKIYLDCEDHGDIHIYNVLILLK
uniref:Wsv390-like protein n=1 Tax=Metapenaeus ensis nimavirus TaxID=2133794 RepID=A0A401IPG0_9VIRU|nr:MAG: wsv390-like protein [Metapenaeus ensis nimavirus]GBG35504.1 wsv390-like protein [Metapenaeus ensis nimavirus]